MRVSGSAGPVVVARGSVDLPTTPFRRPADWPDQMRHRREWTSPIAPPAGAEAAAATRVAERAAAAAAAQDAQQRATRDRKAAHARATRKAPPAVPAPHHPVPPPRVPTPPRPRSARIVDRAEAAALYTRGLSTAQVAEHFGVAPRTIYHHLRAAGVEMRRNGAPPGQPRIDVDEAVRLRADGWTLQRIGDRYGVTGVAVGQRLRAAGVATSAADGRASGRGGGVASARRAEERRTRLGPHLRDLYAQEPQLTLWQIAGALDISEALLKRMVRDLELPSRRKTLDGDEVVRLYVEDGLSINAIAERLGTAGNAIRYRLHAAGVTARPRSQTVRRTPDDVRERALPMLRAGEPVTAVAQALGVGASTVRRWREAAGIPGRPTGARRRATDRGVG